MASVITLPMSSGAGLNNPLTSNVKSKKTRKNKINNNKSNNSKRRSSQVLVSTISFSVTIQMSNLKMIL